jgi:hypothetical protein
MRFFAASILTILSVPAFAQTQCGARPDVTKQLAESYGESVIGMGLAAQGVVEIWAGANGSWTLTVSPPGGAICVIATGEGWQSARRKDKEA